jgi:3-oxoacyl-[acyl-carrier-protein] synthase-3
MTTALGILGTGSYLPDRVVGNAEVADAVGVDPGWIEQRTGVVERRRAAPDQAASDLAVPAAAAALAAAGVAAGDLRYVVVATSTPDRPQPATACLVQDALGAGRAAAFDLNAVCSGFLFALGAVQRMLLAEGGGYGLVIGSDVYSRILDHTDRRTAVLFGDGAGAVVVGPVPPGHGLLGLELRSDGRHHGLIGVPAGGSRLPASAETVADGAHFFRMDGRAVRRYVAEHVPPMIGSLLRAHGAGGVDHFVPHQANGVMLIELAGRLGLTEQTRLTVRQYGNTGAASLPVTLDDAVRRGVVRGGDVVLLAAFGGGMAMGGALERWGGATALERATEELRAS